MIQRLSHQRWLSRWKVKIRIRLIGGFFEYYSKFFLIFENSPFSWGIFLVYNRYINLLARKAKNCHFLTCLFIVILLCEHNKILLTRKLSYLLLYSLVSIIMEMRKKIRHYRMYNHFSEWHYIASLCNSEAYIILEI